MLDDTTVAEPPTPPRLACLIGDVAPGPRPHWLHWLHSLSELVREEPLP